MNTYFSVSIYFPNNFNKQFKNKPIPKKRNNIPYANPPTLVDFNFKRTRKLLHQGRSQAAIAAIANIAPPPNSN